MVWDAIVLAGGRSSRLDGMSKAALLLPTGVTVLERTLAALSDARRIVVVGDAGGHPALSARISDDRLIWTREDPPFQGPVAAIAAGMAAMREHGDVDVAVLACDMPRVDEALPLLRTAVRREDAFSVLARDGANLQYLAGIHRRSALAAALAAHADHRDGMSVRRLLADLSTTIVDVPPGSTADIDTWDDARAFGAVAQHS